MGQNMKRDRVSQDDADKKKSRSIVLFVVVATRVEKNHLIFQHLKLKPWNLRTVPEKRRGS